MLSCTPPENLFCARFFFFQLRRMTMKRRDEERTSLEIDPPLWSWRKFILLSFVSRLWASIVSSDASPRFCTATCHQSSSLWRINQDSNHSLALCLLLPRLDSEWAFNSRTLGKLDRHLKTYDITSFLEKRKEIRLLSDFWTKFAKRWQRNEFPTLRLLVFSDLPGVVWISSRLSA